MTARIKALVFGASGYIGTNLVPRLIEAGWQVRAAARHRAVLEARDWQDVELVAADALDPETLPAAVRDIDIAFYLVHSMAAGKNFAELDLDAAQNFAAAASRAGIKRIVYLGGLIPADPRSLHLISRAETGDVLRHEVSADIATGAEDQCSILSRHAGSPSRIRGDCRSEPRPLQVRYSDVESHDSGNHLVALALKEDPLRIVP